MKVYSELHGKEIQITRALSSVASQEGNDGNEYDIMEQAADFIHKLQKIVKEIVIKSDDLCIKHTFDDETLNNIREIAKVLDWE